MSTRSYLAGRVSTLLALCLAATLLPGSSGRSLAAPVRQPLAPRSWHMVSPVHDGSLTAVGLDGSASGWVAAQDPRGNGATRLYRLQNAQLQSSSFFFPGVGITRIALSSNGTNGWAVGSANNRGALLQLRNGTWTRTNDPVEQSVLTFTSIAIDASGANGWAVGQIEDGGRAVLLRLTNGAWSVYDSGLPVGIILHAVAADPALKYAWLAGSDLSHGGDDVLYFMKNGAWTPARRVGHYVIDDVTVDSSGSGWAGLDTNDEPANSPVPKGLLRLGPDGTWRLVQSSAMANASVYSFSSVRVDPATGNGWAIGYRLGVGSGWPLSVILRLQGDQITGQQYPLSTGVQGPPEQQPIMGQPEDLAVGPDGTAYAVTFEGILWSYGPLPPQGALTAQTGALLGAQQCFPQTNRCLTGAFLTFWRNNGGLERFGLPVTGNILERLDDGKVYNVQYTERARFEYHPEKDPKYQVLLGLLGNTLAQGRQGEPPFQRATQSASIYFPETGHNVKQLASYWQSHGGIPVFGYPISEEFVEKSPTDGKDYLVQYFERNRLELHPEQTDPRYRVLLGLLGVQQFQHLYGRNP